jgi:hypothetical protein
MLSAVNQVPEVRDRGSDRGESGVGKSTKAVLYNFRDCNANYGDGCQ